jgi:hypothetical protein
MVAMIRVGQDQIETEIKASQQKWMPAKKNEVHSEWSAKKIWRPQ